MIVKDLLALPIAHDFKLLAGENGLTNPITSVNIMDNPDALDWLFAGELIVTSGYFFSQSFEQQVLYFKGFKELNIPAICLKPQVFLKGVSKPLIDLCNRLNLPLIEIPYGLAFSKILKTVMNQLSPSLDNEKQFALDIHSKFFEAALNGDGIHHIAQELASTINNPVLITHSNWHVLAHSAFSPALLSTLIPQEDGFIFPTQALDNLPEATAQLKHPIYRNLLFQDGTILCSLMPIYFNHLNYGYIIVYLTNQPLGTMDDIVLETSAMSAALEIFHLTEKERISNRIQRDFFTHLLSDKIRDINELKQFNIPFDYHLEYSALIISVDFTETSQLSIVEEKQREDQVMKTLLNAAHKYINTHFLTMYFFKQGNRLIGLLGQVKGDHSQGNRAKQKETLGNMTNYLETQTDHPPRLITLVGSPQSVLTLSKSYQEARNLQKIVNLTQSGIYFLEDFYLDAFLSEQIASEAAHQFSEKLLKPVTTYDELNHTELLQTLNSYLNNQSNIAVTARELFIHRNTLLYRIKQLQTLLDVDLQNSSHLLSLQLALRLGDIHF